MNKSNPCSTSGSHQCMGASPTFRPRESIVMAIIVGWNVC